MKDIFVEKLKGADSMYAVQGGVLQVLKEQNPPLGYAIGHFDLNNNQQDSKLMVYTRLLAAHLPVFSDVDVFNQDLVDKLQSHGKLLPVELVEFRRTIIQLGKISAVYLLPGWDKNSETIDAYFTAQSSGKKRHVLDHNHPHLRF